jgi:leucyl/phenylalanyl-tRNA--protein transferase
MAEDSFIFPHPFLATKEGVLGIGGDLHPQRLLLAYQFGIFPWYSEGDPIFWWSPHDRFVVYPDQVIVTKSMRPYFNKKKFTLTADKAFESVIRFCQKTKRPGQSGTWITEEMLEAYIQLHNLGYAHSLEVWQDEELVGGLYGISLGKIFFGESMFSLANNASKFAFISLCHKLHELGFWLIDCQQPNPHLERLGGQFFDGRELHELLKKNCFEPTIKGSWSHLFNSNFL